MEAALHSQAPQWVNTVLIWIGFGTLVGLIAKAIMPGRDPGGAMATLLMGIGGSVIGCGALSYFLDGRYHVTPISPLGFICATAGAFLILFFYKMLSGYYFVEGETRPVRRVAGSYSRRRRAPYTTVVEEQV